MPKEPKQKRCVDCPTGSKREAKYPGPRCHTHHFLKKREAKEQAHRASVTRRFGFQDRTGYDRLYKAQNGRCAICRRATGRTKNLAVDHDHKCCNGPTSCGDCIRGLLCSTCNQFLGHIRDDANAFARGIAYLNNPPAREMMKEYARELLADDD
jgi:hypothetical protein